MTNKLRFYLDELKETCRLTVEDDDCQISKVYYGSERKLKSIKKEWQSGKIWF